MDWSDWVSIFAVVAPLASIVGYSIKFRNRATRATKRKPS